MPFGGMCHRTCPDCNTRGVFRRVTNAFRRDVSSDLRVPRRHVRHGKSPMPFGGMCHRTSTWSLVRPSGRRSPMPFGGMCHRTHQNDHRCSGCCRVTNAFRRDVSSDPTRCSWRWVRRPLVTNAFRRDVSSDVPEQGKAALADSRSPMPFGGMCHRTQT